MKVSSIRIGTSRHRTTRLGKESRKEERILSYDKKKTRYGRCASLMTTMRRARKVLGSKPIDKGGYRETVRRERS